MAQHQSDREAFRQVIHEIALGIHGGWVKSKINEASVRQVIVLRLLQAAGFDIWNPLEISPEETFSNQEQRPDLLIRSDGKFLFVLELKKLEAAIEGKEIKQAISYAYDKSIRWALATNGMKWHVYDASQFDSSSRFILELKLTKDNQEEFADDLYRLLDASIWAKNGFEDSVNQVRQDQERRNMVAEKSSALGKFMLESTITDREKAIDFMLRLQLLEQADADALRGKTASPITATNTESTSAKPLLICAGRKGAAYATAILLEGGVLEIQAGSTAAGDMVKSYRETSGRQWLQARDTLIAQGKAKLRPDGLLEYTQPVRYGKPSAASSAILGASSNGRSAWKTSDGKTYADLTQP